MAAADTRMVKSGRIDPTDHAAPRGSCATCGALRPVADLRSARSIRPGIFDLTHKDHPRLTLDDHDGRNDLARSRRLYLQDLLAEKRGELPDLDREVIASLQAGEILAQNPEQQVVAKETFGDRMSDHVAAFGGSRTFIGFSTVLLLGWIVVNSAVVLVRSFDPNP